jgi:hypothetical protein
VSSKPKDLRGLIMAEKYKEPDKIRQYMAALEANLEKATGKPLSHWVKIARTCPHTKTRERLKWFKDVHGLGQSRAGLVLWRAYGSKMLGSQDDPARLVDNLFSKGLAEQRPLYEKIVAHAAKLGRGTVSPRKGYVALYRLKQYGALKPSKKGLILALALKKYPKNAGMAEVKNLGGGERNRMGFVLADAKAFDTNVKTWMKAAYDEA